MDQQGSQSEEQKKEEIFEFQTLFEVTPPGLYIERAASNLGQSSGGLEFCLGDGERKIACGFLG
jgi:hypothetical protein